MTSLAPPRRKNRAETTKEATGEEKEKEKGGIDYRSVGSTTMEGRVANLGGERGLHLRPIPRSWLTEINAGVRDRQGLAFTGVLGGNADWAVNRIVHPATVGTWS